MKRPLGVTVTACVLIVFAAILLLTVAGLAFSLVVAKSTSGPSLLGLSLISAPLVAMIGWFAWTCAGLFHLRPSARTSMQILGSLLILVSLAAFVGSLVFFLALAGNLNSPAHSSGYLAGVLVGSLLPGTVCLALGIWWLVYFNLRSVSALFQPTWLRPLPPTGSFPGPQPGALLQGSPYPVASPYAVRQPGRFDRVPTILQLFACVQALAAFGGLIAALTPLPIFFFGAILRGSAGHFAWAAFALLTGATAWGLLHLQHWGRLLAWLLILLGTVNLAFSLTQRALDNLNAYVLSMLQSLHLPFRPELQLHYTPAMMLPSALFGLAVYAAVGWSLHKHRDRFL